MIDLDKILSHIKRVESNTQKLAKVLWHTDRRFALDLIKRGRLHDLSKLDDFEFDFLNDISTPELFKEALEHHHEHNSHHPEHFVSIHNMTDLDIAEMVCDLTARAQEFGTDVREWIVDSATKKYDFKMSDKIGEKIIFYLELLLEPKFKKR